MKKKVLVVSLAIAVLAITMIGGSLAWFMDEDEATNVFTFGSIEITQNEDFVQESMLLPVVGGDPTVSTDNYIKKMVNVTNDGKNAAYVQTFIAVPAVLDNNGILKQLYNESADWEVSKVAADVTVPGETLLYNVYRYRYTKELAPTDTTSNNLEYVYIDKTIDLNVYDTDNDNVNDTAYFVLADGTEITGFNAAGKLNVYAATQAVQVKGFGGYTVALDSAFADHPWAV
ncbi:MAG: hypothetical protein IKM48_02615 [Clostridia bacterium]|nr:hypothetical protein [Clostridia bacterium]